MTRGTFKWNQLLLC